MEKTKKRLRTFRTLLWGVQVTSWFSLLAPILILLYINKDVYFKQVESMKVGLPSIIGIVLIGFILIKQLKLGGFVFLGILYAILELFKGIIKDLQLIVLVVAISYGLWRLFQPLIKSLKKRCDLLLASYYNASAMQEVYQPEMEVIEKKRGRV